MQKTPPGWCQWLKERSRVHPDTLRYIEQLKILKAPPPGIAIIQNISNYLVQELCNIQKTWNDAAWFTYYSHAKYSASLDPHAYEKAQRRNIDRMDYQSHVMHVSAYTDTYFSDLNIPLSDSYIEGLQEKFGSAQANAVMHIIQNAVHTRIVAEEMLHLFKEKEVVNLPGIQQFTERTILFAGADDIW